MTELLQPSLRTHIEALLNPVFDASLTNPETPSRARVNRRFFKLYEELGEVSEAHLDLTEGGYKQLTFEDLETEVVDVFIVYVDQAITVTRLVLKAQEGSVEQLRTAMVNHLERALTTPSAMTTGELLTQLVHVTNHAHLNIGMLENNGMSMYLKVILGIESLFQLLAQDPRPKEHALDATDRLAVLASRVEEKIAKWKHVRTVCN